MPGRNNIEKSGFSKKTVVKEQTGTVPVALRVLMDFFAHCSFFITGKFMIDLVSATKCVLLRMDLC